MTDWLNLTDAQRKTSIDQAAITSGINSKSIEKDWWVTLTLKALFQTEYAQFLVFKGGTSLSKCWKVIQRFSEDIDIVIDTELFGIPYVEEPTKSYLSRLKKKGCKFTSNELKKAIEKQFIELGVTEGTLEIIAEDVDPTMTDKDPQTLFIKYKSLYDPNPYLADRVKVEVGVRSKIEPYTRKEVQSILTEVYPNDVYPEKPFTVQVVETHKTFLEKAFLLHEEFKKPNRHKIRTERMSRHFYDLEKLMDTEACKKALADKDLYATIIHHRAQYNKLNGIDYTLLNRITICFVPPEEFVEGYLSDYATMREHMIYGESLEPIKLFERISELQKRFNSFE